MLTSGMLARRLSRLQHHPPATHAGGVWGAFEEQSVFFTLSEGNSEGLEAP
jgi:hypothetical protein